MTTQDELLELNVKITEMEDEYINAKLYYETKKAELLLTTDFGVELGKAKPTVAEKDAWVKMQCSDDEANYKYVGVTIGSMKRELEIRLKMCGDD